MRYAAEVLAEVFRHRRLRGSCTSCVASARGACPACLRPHLARISRFVARGEPIHFVLPAFPAKSPSPAKVLGPRADMAEEISLRYLNAVCDRVAEVYPPGARITICSDGHVFADVVGVTDADVSNYAADVRSMIDTLDLRCLTTFSLADVFDGSGFSEMRARLLARFGEPLDSIRARIHRSADGRALYNGIHRFLFEDALRPSTATRNQIRRECGERVYAVIQRSTAWSAAVAAAFPEAVRLSIHPQAPQSDKIGIRLGDTTDPWLTPWHAVALEGPRGFRLVHRAGAEALGALLVEREGRPSHYRTEHDGDVVVAYHLEVA
jgi:pyoverdine/dityrosine biosynthesis protein Dit1